MSTATDYQAPVLAWYEFMATGDRDALRALAHPEIDFIVAEGFPRRGHYVGFDAVFGDFLREPHRHGKN